MSRASRSRYLTSPSPRVSAWLADIDDWDANDADVFVATLGRGVPSLPQALETEERGEASRIA